MVRFPAWLVLALALSLSACGVIEDRLQSVSDKVNAAFPPGKEIVEAREALFAGLQQKDAATHEAWLARWRQQLALRAQACSQGAGIGRFDSTEEARRKIGSPACFLEQDARLAGWIGMHRVIRGLRQPPLVPLGPMPARVTLPVAQDFDHQVVAASAANVVSVRPTGTATLVVQSLPSGNVISRLQVPRATTTPGSLSPNGAVFAQPAGSTVAFFDSATGRLLWLADGHKQLLAWVPEMDATLLAGTESAPVLLDHRKGTIEPLPGAIARASWAVPLPTTRRLLIGYAGDVALLQLARTADGSLTTQPLRQWSLEQGVTSGSPMVMLKGRKLVYPTGLDLGWLDLENGTQGVWELHALAPRGHARISDTQVYLDLAPNGDYFQRFPYLLDVEKETLTPAEADEHTGFVAPLGTRDGYARRGSGATILLRTAASARGEPKPVQAMIAEARLAQELAKVAAAARAPQQGMSTGTPAPGGSSVPAAMLKDIATDARVVAVGVYESASAPQGRGRENGGPVIVTIGPGRGKLVLVLASYEPVRWVVRENGRTPVAILLSGYSPSTVVGSSAPVYRIGSAYAYRPDGEGYPRLQQDVARFVASPIATFQGVYGGKEFSVY